jgi:hypothetical protein
MIEHTLYNIGIFLFVPKFQHVYELWPAWISARPGQILGRLQFKTMYLYASKVAPIQPFDMISSSIQGFHILWTRLLHIQKSKNILFWPSYCKISILDNLLVGPSRTNKSEIDMLSWFFLKKLPWWLLLSMHISTTSMLRSNFMKEYFFFFLSWQPLVKKRIVLIWSLS